MKITILYFNKIILISPISLLLILSAESSSAIECGSVPTDDCDVTQNTTFNTGNYTLPNGINIKANDLVLDCNGSVLIGDRSSEGIEIYSSSSRNSNTIKNCNIKNYSYGIRVWGPHSYNTVINNTLEDNEYGVSLDNLNQYDNVRYNVIENNTILYNDYGVYLENGVNIEHNNVTGNIVTNSTVKGIKVSAMNPNNIWNNDLYSEGIAYYYTNSIYCIDNIPNYYFDGATGPSCSCFPPLDTTININTDTVLCEGTYNLPNVVVGLDGSNFILDCNNSVLIGDRSNAGIRIYHSSSLDHNTIKNCNIKNYSYGIRVWGPHSYNVIENNSLEDNTYGVHLARLNTGDEVRYNVIKRNTLLDNDYGVYFSSGSSEINYNDIWGNLFIDNPIQASDSGTNNSWNNSGGGNYWNDYDSEPEGCFDSNSNLICDEPYNITGSAGSKDYLPLTGIQINEIIPIQVIKSVDMIKSKTTLVRSTLKNTGSVSEDVTVKLYFEGDFKNSTTATINAGQEKDVDLWFVPDVAGDNKEIEIVVEEN